MEIHFHAGDEDDTCRYVGEHRKTGCHIIGLVAHEGADQMHGHIRSPEHEIMNKKSQGIEKINQDQLPVFPEVFKYSPVFLTVIRKELMDFRPFQYCCEEESHRQS